MPKNCHHRDDQDVACACCEAEWVGRLVTGDEHAFQILYEYYSPPIYGRLLRLVKSTTLAEDLLQQTFLNLWNSRAALDPQRSLSAYLFTIAGNLTLNAWRKAKRDKLLMASLLSGATEQYNNPTEEWLVKKENAQHIRRAIDALPPQRRKVFRLCKLEERSYAEVSHMLGISHSAVNDHIVKAVRTIKRHLVHEGRLSAYILFLPLLQ